MINTVSTPDYPPLHLLLVDSDDKSGNRLHRKFSKQAWTTDWVKPTQISSEKLRRDEYDLALINNDIPNGKELLTQIRRENQEIPVMVLSSTQTTQERTEYIKNGADDCLTKPYSHEELLARLNALFRRKEVMDTGKTSRW